MAAIPVSDVAPLSSPTPTPGGAVTMAAPIIPAPAPSSPVIEDAGPNSASSRSMQMTSLQPGAPEGPDLRSTALYLNRELSWLEFNARVLDEAESESVPLLERLKFHAIVASNLDEFFMVRVAGLKQQLTGDVGELAADGLSAHEQLVKISLRAHELVGQQMASLMGNLLPRLAGDGTLVILKPE